MAKLSLDQFVSALTSLSANQVIPKRRLGYVRIPNQISLSFSKLSTFHTCPRKFQLSELVERELKESNLHLAFGSALGAGIQALWKYDSLEIATLKLIEAWDYDFFEDIWGKIKHKSLYQAILSLRNYFNFIYILESKTWKFAELQIKSDEFLFLIQLSPQFNYQGHIDLILEHRITSELKVVEVKTKSVQHLAAHWRNSMQTKGYFTVLRYLAHKTNRPMNSSVQYLCFTATSACQSIEQMFGFTQFEFDQNLIGSDFIISLAQEIQTLHMYLEDNHFPMRGSSCITFNSPCSLFLTCDSTAAMQELPQVSQQSEEKYKALTLDDCDLVVDFAELMQAY